MIYSISIAMVTATSVTVQFGFTEKVFSYSVDIRRLILPCSLVFCAIRVAGPSPTVVKADTLKL